MTLHRLIRKLPVDELALLADCRLAGSVTPGARPCQNRREGEVGGRLARTRWRAEQGGRRRSKGEGMMAGTEFWSHMNQDLCPHVPLKAIWLGAPYFPPL